MIKKVWVGIVLALVANVSAHADDAAIAVQLYGVIAIQGYELEYLDSDSGEAPISLNLPMFGVGSAVTYGQWFADVNLAQSFRRSSRNGSISANASNSLERDSVRSSYGVSGGYVFGNGLVAFVGFKQSQSTFDETTTNTNSGSNPPTVNVTQAETTFRNSGPYVGAAYSLPVTGSSAITMHGAIGRFSGVVESEDPAVEESNDLATTGVSLGAKAKLILSEKLDAALGVDWREFEYSASGKGDLYRERVINLQLQLSFIF